MVPNMKTLKAYYGETGQDVVVLRVDEMQALGADQLCHLIWGDGRCVVRRADGVLILADMNFLSDYDSEPLASSAF
jgi:hypothetical protein